jgi:Flp pilus assembly protein TadG
MRRQRGHVMITTAIMAVVLIAFAGIATDISYLEHVRRRMQTAADAGALSGGWQILRAATQRCDDGTVSPSVNAAAKADSALNGYTDGSSNTTVTVNCPPVAGFYAGDFGAVEVVVRQTNQPMFFMKIFPSATQGTVAARAVAHLGSGEGCLIALGGPGAPFKGSYDGITVNGTADVDVGKGCAVISNDTMCTKGGGELTSGSNSAVNVGGGGCGSNFTPALETGVLPATDPLKNVFVSPTPTSCGAAVCGSGTAADPYRGWTTPPKSFPTGTVYFAAGPYYGGIHLTSGMNAVFAPSGSSTDFIMGGGGFGINSAGTVTATGVMFYLTGRENASCGAACTAYDTVQINGGTNTFSAPATGADKSVLFASDPAIVPRNSTMYDNKINGNTGSSFNGVFYFPNSGLTFNGTSGGGGNNIAIFAQAMTIGGTATLAGNFSAMPGGGVKDAAVLGE